MPDAHWSRWSCAMHMQLCYFVCAMVGLYMQKRAVSCTLRLRAERETLIAKDKKEDRLCR